MSAPPTLLVPVDFSSYSRAAIERALQLSKASGARIRLLHVFAFPLIALEHDPLGPFSADLRASEFAKLERLRKEFEGSGQPIAVSFEEGDPAQVIHSAARSPEVELIVMGCRGLQGLKRSLIGSTTDRTLRGAPVPVWVCRGSGSSSAPPVESILFATDFSPSARQTESVVAHWARRLRVAVEVVHVVPDTTVLFVPYAVPESRIFDDEVFESAERRVDRVVERLRDQGVAAKSRLIVGYASHEIVNHAASTGAAVIAMGSRGNSGLRRFRLGSVVQNVLADAPCSVLIGTEAALPDDE